MGKRRWGIVVVCALLMVSAAFAGQARTSAHGRSLTDWMTQYWSWFLGGGAQNGDGNIRFLPLPSGTLTDTDPDTYTGSMSGDWKQSKGFALPVFVYVGETYVGTTPDDSPDDVSDDIFLNADVLVTLDGSPILDSEVDDLSDFLFGPGYFDETIPYAETTGSGADGAIWVKGLGLLHGPLHRGVHTIHLSVYSPDYNLVFDNTWTLDVKK